MSITKKRCFLDLINDITIISLFGEQMLQPTTSNVKELKGSFKVEFDILALGFLHSRTNLSPFTKDFRGGDQLDEYLAIFLRSGLVQTDIY